MADEEKTVTEEIKEKGYASVEKAKDFGKGFPLLRRLGLKRTSRVAKGTESATYKKLRKWRVWEVMASWNSYLRDEIEKKYITVENTIYANLKEIYKDFGHHHTFSSAKVESEYLQGGTCEDLKDPNKLDYFTIKIAGEPYKLPIPPEKPIYFTYNGRRFSYPIRCYGFKLEKIWEHKYNEEVEKIFANLIKKATSKGDIYADIPSDQQEKVVRRLGLLKDRIIYFINNELLHKMKESEKKIFEEKINPILGKEKPVNTWKTRLDDNMLPWERIVYKHTWRIIEPYYFDKDKKELKEFLKLEVHPKTPDFTIQGKEDPNTDFFYRKDRKEKNGKDEDGDPLRLDEQGLVLQDRDKYNLPMKEWRYLKGEDFNLWSIEKVDRQDTSTTLIKRTHPITGEVFEEFRRLDRGERGLGLDARGRPLEVGDGKYTRHGIVLADVYDYNVKDLKIYNPDEIKNLNKNIKKGFERGRGIKIEYRILGKKDFERFVGEVSPLDQAQQMTTMWDEFRDDFRDGRYHPNSITIMQWIERFRKNDPYKLMRPQFMMHRAFTSVKKFSEEERKKFTQYTHRRYKSIPPKDVPQKKLLGIIPKGILKKDKVRVPAAIMEGPARFIKKKGLRLYNDKFHYGKAKPSHLVPAFEWGAFKKEAGASKDERPVWKHIGKKYYYDSSNHVAVADQKDSAMSSRGIAMFTVYFVYQFEKYYDDMVKIFEAFPHGYDFGPRTLSIDVPLNKRPFEVDTAAEINKGIRKAFEETNE